MASSLTPPENEKFIAKFRELQNEARQKHNDTQSHSYAKIIRALKRYPLPIFSGREAQYLEGVGNYSSDVFDIVISENPCVPSSHVCQKTLHRKKLLQEMTQFHGSLKVTSPPDSGVNVAPEVGQLIQKEKKMKKSNPSSLNNNGSRIRFTKNTSAFWLILAIFFISGKNNRETFRWEVENYLESYAKTFEEPKAKIASWQIAKTLVKEGYLTCSPTPQAADEQSSSKSRKKLKTDNGYSLTQLGITKGNELAAKLDNTLIQAIRLTRSSSKETIAELMDDEAEDSIRRLVVSSVQGLHSPNTQKSNRKNMSCRDGTSLRHRLQRRQIIPRKVDFAAVMAPAKERQTEDIEKLLDDKEKCRFEMKRQDNQEPSFLSTELKVESESDAEPKSSTRKINSQSYSPEMQSYKRLTAQILTEKRQESITVSSNGGNVKRSTNCISAITPKPDSVVEEANVFLGLRLDGMQQAGEKVEKSEGLISDHVNRNLIEQVEDEDQEVELLLCSLLSEIPQRTFQPSDFEIKLLVDHREISSQQKGIDDHDAKRRKDKDLDLIDSSGPLFSKKPFERVQLTCDKVDLKPFLVPPKRFSKCKATLVDVLKRRRIQFESSNLAIGDFIWICRFHKPEHVVPHKKLRRLKECLKTSGDVANEINQTTNNRPADHRDSDYTIDFMLEYIVERKTIPDLINSIVDGRFDDQKFRLLRSPGISKIIFLIEGTEEEMKLYVQNTSSHYRKSLGFHHIRGALVNVQLINGFSIIYSESIAHTASILAGLDLQIRHSISCQLTGVGASPNQFLFDLIASHPLREIWTKKSKKLTTVLDVFGKQLRMIKDFGEAAVDFILSQCKTPYQLSQALMSCPSNKLILHRWKMQKQLDGKQGRIVTPINEAKLKLLRELYAPASLRVSSEFIEELELELKKPKNVRIAKLKETAKLTESELRKRSCSIFQGDSKKKSKLETRNGTCDNMESKSLSAKTDKRYH